VLRELQLVVGGLVALVALLLATAMGCGDDGGEGEVTPTAVPAAVEQQLTEMVLQLEDLPSGVIRAEEFFVTNEESAASSEDREGRLAKLTEWGRILGYDVTYQANPEVTEQVGLVLVNSTASLYATEEGARASFADGVQTARTTDWSTLFGDAEGVEETEIASPPLVDEMLWLRITARGDVGEEPQEVTLANDIAIFRQGPARASIMVAWIMDSGNSDVMEELARTQAQRLKDTLP
jgi:hypothetical protein